jgi:hypothetical protein
MFYNSTSEWRRRSGPWLRGLYVLTWIALVLSFFVLLYLSISPRTLGYQNTGYGFPFCVVSSFDGYEIDWVNVVLDLALLVTGPVVSAMFTQRLVDSLYEMLRDGPPRLHLSTLLVVVNCVGVDLLLNSIAREKDKWHEVYGWPLRAIYFEYGWGHKMRHELACEFINILTLVLIALMTAFICEWRIYKRRTGVRRYADSAVLPQENG